MQLQALPPPKKGTEGVFHTVHISHIVHISHMVLLAKKPGKGDATLSSELQGPTGSFNLPASHAPLAPAALSLNSYDLKV